MFLSLRGEAFQDFFAGIMARVHPNDFIRTRPWGNSGDRKNDGYLKSQRILYQVYAPNEMEASKAVSKINEDFAGALPYWERFFDTWTFVHNALNGLGPDILTCLLDLEARHSQVRLAHLGYEGLELKAMSLEENHLEAVLGLAPDARSISAVRSSDLIQVIETIGRAEGLTEAEILPVSPEKINKNGLSVDSKFYLRTGQRKSSLVKAIFDSFPDPLASERIVQSFRNKYLDLKLQKLPGDQILSELIGFAGGYSDQRSLPDMEIQRHEAAVSAVLAYLFESCEIFEDRVDGDDA